MKSRLALGCLALTGAVAAQQLIHTLPGREPGAWFGAVLASADLDGDGVQDLIVGASKGLSFRGFVGAWSGTTGRPIWVTRGEHSGDLFGTAVAVVGDVDGDGVPEVAVGAPERDNGTSMDAGALYLLSGRTGTVLRSLLGQDAGARFGGAVAAAGDADLDNSPDVAVSAPSYLRNNITGLVYIVRGLDFVEVRRFQYGQPGFGRFLAGMHDVRSPGPAILISQSENPLVGISTIFSASTGNPLISIPYGVRGVSLGADINRDGYGDILLAMQPEVAGLPVYVLTTSLTGGGFVIRSVTFDPRAKNVGSCMAPIGDADGDLVMDYVIGSSDVVTNGPRGGQGDGYSGSTGALLFRLFGDAYEEFGSACTGLGDVNGDGVADFAVGAPFASGATTADGVVRVYSGRALRLHADVTEVSQRAGGAQTLRIELGAPSAGMPYAILGSMTGVQPGVNVLGVHVPLNFDPYTSLTWTSANGPVFQNTMGTLDGVGGGQAVIRVPPSPTLVGLAVVHACVWFDASFGLRGATGAVPLRIGA